MKLPELQYGNSLPCCTFSLTFSLSVQCFLVNIFLAFVLNLYITFVDTLIFFSPQYLLMAALVVPNDQTTKEYIFAIYSNTLFQREIAGMWILLFLFEKEVMTLPGNFISVFKAMQTGSAIEKRVVLSDFRVPFFDSVTGNPFMEMFGIAYYLVLIFF